MDAISALRTELAEIRKSFVEAVEAKRAREGDDFGY